jgi:hypothetical protein
MQALVEAAAAAAAAAGNAAAAEQQRAQALASWAASHPQGKYHQAAPTTL